MFFHHLFSLFLLHSLIYKPISTKELKFLYDTQPSINGESYITDSAAVKNREKLNLNIQSSINSIFLRRASSVFKTVQPHINLTSSTLTVPNEEGAFCRRSFDGRSGYCILAYQCLHTMREHRKHGIKIDICKYHKNVPVICCLLEDKQVVEQRISATKCQEYHSALNGMHITASRSYKSSKQCVSSVPMIVGGKRTQRGAYPHMTALGWTQTDRTIKFGCGGTLISEQFVLTAAHCVTSDIKPPDIVRLGVQQLNETTRQKRDVRILIIILHPKYSSSAYYHDIALLRLTKRLRFTDIIRPACLWQHPEIPQRSVIATGWGRTEFLGPQSNDLLKVDLNMLDQRLCREFYQSERRLSRGIIENQFCAGHMTGGKDTCQGDSGGPVHIELPEYNCVKFVVGITSFGKFCAAPGAPGVYTKVYNYIDWIEKVVFKS